MTILWATQYRPENLTETITAVDAATAIFADVGAIESRVLVPITHDVGTMSVVTIWDSVGDAVAAFDPVEGTLFAAIADNPRVAAAQAGSGAPLRRIVANIESERGELAGKYAVNVVQTSNAGPELWAEAAELAASFMESQGARGMRIARVITGEATGQTMATVLTDDVNRFFGALDQLPPRLGEIFA
jgi:hypothetical protein